MASWVDIVGAVEVHEPLARYTAVLEDRVGPFRLRADLEVLVTDLVDQDHIQFRAEGEDRQVGSRLVIEAGMAMAEADEGLEVTFDGQYSVEGKVATMGGGVIKHKADLVLDQFVSHAEEALA